jgi:hypothetical protein
MMMRSSPGRFGGRHAVALLLVLILMTMIGCGKKKIENPYEPGTLSHAVSGESQNKLFKFELTEPQIIAVEGRLALLAEESRIEFLIGDDLSLLNTVDAGYKLGVKRDWGATPEVYLVLEHVIDGPDTSFITSDEAPIFPSYQNFVAFDRSAYSDLATELGGMSGSDSESMLKAFGKQGSKVWLDGVLTRGDIGGERSYFLETSLGKYKLDGVSPLAEVFMKAVLAEGGATSCGGPLGEINRRSVQRSTGLKGSLALEYFRYQSYLITNG